MCAEGMVCIAICALAMVFTPSGCTSPAETTHVAGSAREPTRHTMCTSDYVEARRFNAAVQW